MRKRLRKKLRLAEFEDVLVPIGFDLADAATQPEIDEFVDTFIDIIESAGLGFGGGGVKSWGGFAQSAKASSPPTAVQADAVRTWLTHQPLVIRCWVGQPMKSSEIDRHLLNDPDFPTAAGPSSSPSE
jgi:uncharacterized protein YggL (DUF469 family)